MRTVKATNRQTGEIIPRFFAEEVTPDTRRTLAALYNYTCLGCDTATYHWRRGVRYGGNIGRRAETFVKNRGTYHGPGCRYDYEGFGSDETQSVYYKDGQLHVRLNFPLGAAPADRFPPVRDFNIVAKGARKPEKHPVSRLRDLTDLMEKQFGSLEDVPMSDVDFEYRGQSYRWDELFIASDRYGELYDAAYNKRWGADSDPRLVVVKPMHEIEANSNGLRRFVCEAQYAQVAGRHMAIKPVIVCDNAEMANYVRLMIDRRRTGWDKKPKEAERDVLLIAARPFPAREAAHPLREMPVYLAASNLEQLARIEGKAYWRPVPGAIHQMNFLKDLDSAAGPAHPKR